MERESFSDANIARLLNDNFIPIKVDREERPDVDQVYMTFVQVPMRDSVYLLALTLAIFLSHTCRQLPVGVAGQCLFG